MDARIRRLPRPIRRLSLLPFTPAAALLWLAGQVLLRLVRHGWVFHRPQDVVLYRAGAAHALQRGNLRSAACFAQYVIAATPTSPDGYCLLHRAYLRDGKREEARAPLEEGLPSASTNTERQLAMAALNELGQRARAAPS